MDEVRIYTDGACSGNPGPGGWGAVLMHGKREKEISGASANTTNNRMELTAAIEGLKALRKPCRVRIYTDSAYLARAFNDGWLARWIKRDWKTASKKPVENQDLWQQLLQLTNTHKVRFIKVKGHADDPLNNRVDRLAVDAMRKAM